VTNETGPTDRPIEVIQSADIPTAQPAIQLMSSRSLLGGRYPLAISLALLGAVIGASVGYFMLEPEYKSVGVINVRPSLPRILFANEQNIPLPLFNAFLASQVAQIQSRRVTGEAMLLPEWKALGRGLTPDAVAEFEKHLRVKNPWNTPLIKVTFADRDPNAAAIAVKAVIQTYERFYNNSEAESGVPAMNVLENRRIELSAKLNGTNDQILAIANDFGSSSLQEVYEFKLSELNSVESQLRRAQIQIALAGPATALTTGPATQSGIAAMDADVALRDPTMRDPLRQKADAARQVRQQLLENQEALRRLYDDLKRETIELGRKNLAIDKLRNEAQDARERLEETKKRIEQLNFERNGSGRISIISYGDVPFEPDKDRRAAGMAVGGLGLAACGVGFAVLVGFMDRRRQRPDPDQRRDGEAEAQH
jgi:uncharacterized protein involved in exopolysaccharide biosynthesis